MFLRRTWQRWPSEAFRVTAVLPGTGCSLPVSRQRRSSYAQFPGWSPARGVEGGAPSAPLWQPRPSCCLVTRCQGHLCRKRRGAGGPGNWWAGLPMALRLPHRLLKAALGWATPSASQPLQAWGPPGSAAVPAISAQAARAARTEGQCAGRQAGKQLESVCGAQACKQPAGERAAAPLPPRTGLFLGLGMRSLRDPAGVPACVFLLLPGVLLCAAGNGLRWPLVREGVGLSFRRARPWPGRARLVKPGRGRAEPVLLCVVQPNNRLFICVLTIQSVPVARPAASLH